MSNYYTAVTSRLYWSEAVNAIREMARNPTSGEFSNGDADRLEETANDIRRANARQPLTKSDLERALEFFKTMGFARPEEGLSNYKLMTVQPFHSPYSDGPPGTLVILDDEHSWYFDPNGRLDFIGGANP